MAEQITKQWLQDLYDEHKNPELEFNGTCHDCNGLVSVITILNDNGSLTVSGGAIWKIKNIKNPFFKCEPCFEKDNQLRNFQTCEVYARVVGYLRPVRQFNLGKREEFKFRKNFEVVQ